MTKIFKTNRLRWISLWLIGCMLCVTIGQASAGVIDASSANSLRAKFAELEKKLSSNQYKQPLYLDSVESPDHLSGDIYVLVSYPFATVHKALNDPAHWCDILILHINTKHCRASKNESNNVLSVSIGKKIFQPLDEAYRLEFTYNSKATTREYFNVRLNAITGPMGTSDYRIRLEAVSVAGGKTFLHLTYSYAYDFVGQLAMQAYLATIGSSKVGFTTIGDQSETHPEYISGVRGVVERNTMRYYLAIDAYLNALSAAPPKQLEKRLTKWFESTEKYPRQLREVDRSTYLDLKRREYLRQQKTQ